LERFTSSTTSEFEEFMSIAVEREVWYLVFPSQMFIACSQASCRQSEELNGIYSFLFQGNEAAENAELK
jgi:hypothetical protein